MGYLFISRLISAAIGCATICFYSAAVVYCLEGQKMDTVMNLFIYCPLLEVLCSMYCHDCHATRIWGILLNGGIGLLMCRSHTWWVFLDLGHFATSWVPVSYCSIDLFSCVLLHLKVMVGSSYDALVLFCRTTRCALCVLPFLCHIRSSQVDLLPLQEVALLSSGESNYVLHFSVMEMG